MTSAPTVSHAADLLRELLGDRLLQPADANFPAAVTVWNGAVDRAPAMIARCRDVGEVAAVLRVARRCRLPLTVRVGGHDWAGRALRDGGLVLDLTGMREVEVDPAAGTVTVAGGVTAADVVAALRPYDLVVATGVVRSVGLAGLTLAGGYGPLCGRHGLALDNLLAAEVVLADGRRRPDPRARAVLGAARRRGQLRGGNPADVPGAPAAGRPRRDGHVRPGRGGRRAARLPRPARRRPRRADRDGRLPARPAG
ncbi:FAD-binding oxidoreductase [Micromonospora psammae]|uniref:FAD-binding oxidoreductase n=1 Tax=Micromonospora sp. CPCC 205556 TaxID=3122398 RepID=UPI002FF12357